MSTTAQFPTHNSGPWSEPSEPVSNFRLLGVIELTMLHQLTSGSDPTTMTKGGVSQCVAVAAAAVNTAISPYLEEAQVGNLIHKIHLKFNYIIKHLILNAIFFYFSKIYCTLFLHFCCDVSS